ncbi:MAG: hypothetical protein ABI759_28740 [Candidatus Solibacter sp.]
MWRSIGWSDTEAAADNGRIAKPAAPGYVVHSGEVTLPLARGILALPFADL